MIPKVGKPSYSLLVFLALLSLVFFYLAERSQKPRRAAFYEQKVAAARLAAEAQEIVKSELVQRGFVIDVQNDPNLTGMIGPQYSPITTDRGYIRDKLISTNPNNAAVLIDLFHRARLEKGDKVAVLLTGSFPAMNLAVLAACRVLELDPVIISSVGSSTWGATWENFTWLDIEVVIYNAGLWPYRSVAASVGGGNDHGRGLSPEGRDLLLQAIARNGVQLISSITEQHPSGSLDRNIKRRIEILDSLKGDSEYKAVVNVGGGLAAVGSAQNARLIPPGYNSRLYERELPSDGVVTILARRRVPAIHLLQLDRFAQRYNLPTDVVPKPEIGEGEVFVQERYSITTTVIYTGLLLAVLWVAIRVDFRYYIYRNKHLFVRRSA